jgi:hypothetical protein
VHVNANSGRPSDRVSCDRGLYTGRTPGTGFFGPFSLHFSAPSLCVCSLIGLCSETDSLQGELQCHTVCVYAYICMYVCVCVCIYIYIYTTHDYNASLFVSMQFTDVSTHIHMHTRTNKHLFATLSYETNCCMHTDKWYRQYSVWRQCIQAHDPGSAIKVTFVKIISCCNSCSRRVCVSHAHADVCVVPHVHRFMGTCACA